MNTLPRLIGVSSLVIGLALWPALAMGDDAGTGVIAYTGKVLLDTKADTLGKPFSYPAGTPRIISQVVSLAPGATSNPNIHQTPMYLQVLEGDLTVDYGPAGKKVYHPGDAFIEAQGVAHHGINDGKTPVTFLAVYIGAEGVANEVSP